MANQKKTKKTKSLSDAIREMIKKKVDRKEIVTRLGKFKAYKGMAVKSAVSIILNREFKKAA